MAVSRTAIGTDLTTPDLGTTAADERVIRTVVAMDHGPHQSNASIPVRSAPRISVWMS